MAREPSGHRGALRVPASGSDELYSLMAAASAGNAVYGNERDRPGLETGPGCLWLPS
jgi:hypothetical protein